MEERPELYCPVCRRPTLIEPGATMLDSIRRLVRHLWDTHDDYIAAQLRTVLNSAPSDPFYPRDDGI